MFRFTIRDVLWLTVVVALGAALWNEQRQVMRITKRSWQLEAQLEDYRGKDAANKTWERYLESANKSSAKAAAK